MWEEVFNPIYQILSKKLFLDRDLLKKIIQQNFDFESLSIRPQTVNLSHKLSPAPKPSHTKYGSWVENKRIIIDTSQMAYNPVEKKNRAITSPSIKAQTNGNESPDIDFFLTKPDITPHTPGIFPKNSANAIFVSSNASRLALLERPKAITRNPSGFKNFRYNDNKFDTRDVHSNITLDHNLTWDATRIIDKKKISAPPLDLGARIPSMMKTGFTPFLLPKKDKRSKSSLEEKKKKVKKMMRIKQFNLFRPSTINNLHIMKEMFEALNVSANKQEK